MKTNLEVSRQLKEMGVGQESEYCWYYLGINNRKYEVALSEKVKSPIASAFTLSELVSVSWENRMAT